jgi:hypothetical protein
MPTSEYEDDEAEELYDMTEEILQEHGKDETNTTITRDWNSVVGNKAHHNNVGPYRLGKTNQRANAHQFLSKKWTCYNEHDSKNLKEGCKPGKFQGIEADSSWTIYL